MNFNETETTENRSLQSPMARVRCVFLTVLSGVSLICSEGRQVGTERLLWRLKLRTGPKQIYPRAPSISIIMSVVSHVGYTLVVALPYQRCATTWSGQGVSFRSLHCLAFSCVKLAELFFTGIGAVTFKFLLMFVSELFCGPLSLRPHSVVVSNDFLCLLQQRSCPEKKNGELAKVQALSFATTFAFIVFVTFSVGGDSCGCAIADAKCCQQHSWTSGEWNETTRRGYWPEWKTKEEASECAPATNFCRIAGMWKWKTLPKVPTDKDWASVKEAKMTLMEMHSNGALVELNEKGLEISVRRPERLYAEPAAFPASAGRCSRRVPHCCTWRR